MKLNQLSEDGLRLGDKVLSSRLLMGTGKFSSREVMLDAIKASGSQLITVAIRRFNKDQDANDDLYSPLSKLDGVNLMPNTSGARTADEAVRAALLARELCGSSFVKVEIHPNPHHLMPDPIETYEACKQLVKEGMIVLPYMPADPVLAKRMEDIGCAAVMPLGSAIGSGRGLQTREMLEIIIRDANIPVIVDAGIRSPAEAALAIEIGCDAVLVNSAVAVADNPVLMAKAFAAGVETGCMARKAGLMSSGNKAVATSPLLSFLGDSKA